MNDLATRLRGIKVSVVHANRVVLGTKPLTAANEIIKEAADRIEAQEKLIEEMREAFKTFLHEAPSTLSCGMRCQLEIEHMEEEAYMAAYANAEFYLSKASKSNPNTPERSDK